MVKAEDSLPCPLSGAWQLPDLKCISTLPEPKSLCFPAGVNARNHMCAAHDALPGFKSPSLPIWRTDAYEAERLLQFLPTGFQTMTPYPKLYSKEIQPQSSSNALLEAAQNANSEVSLKRKFLIFDHSGNKTRLLCFPVFSHIPNPVAGMKNFSEVYNANEKEPATKVGQNDLAKFSLQEESDENHMTGEVSEMHEDTEEINALLYSDDDFDGYSDDDEVTSTGHSPLAANIENQVKQNRFNGINEEVASSGGPNKRQKLVGGGSERSSQLDTTSSVKLDETYEYVSDAESRLSFSQSYPSTRTLREVDSAAAADRIQLKKDSIQKKLRIVEDIVPDAKGKQPLMVIDKTMECLKIFMSNTNTSSLNHH